MLNNSLEYSLFPSFSPSSNRVMRTLLICTKNPAHARTKLLNQPHGLKYAHQLTIAWHTAAYSITKPFSATPVHFLLPDH